MPLQGVITDLHIDLEKNGIYYMHLRFFELCLAYAFLLSIYCFSILMIFLIKLKVKLSRKLSGYFR